MKQQKSNILIGKQKKYNPKRGNQSGKGELTVFGSQEKQYHTRANKSKAIATTPIHNFSDGNQHNRPYTKHF